jgi:type II secretory pathway pseudopilin PulG
VELLIVVALLALILTLSLPSLRKLSSKSELRNAARQLRVTLLESRLAAIESGGLTYVRYQPGGERFEAGRGSELSTLPARTKQPMFAAEPDQPGSAAAAPHEASQPQRLPRGVRFADSLTERQLPTPAAVGELPDADSWSTPILFYPNGRTRNARIELVNEAYRIELNVRGLTGTVQISQVERLPSPEAGTLPTTSEAAP